MALCRVAPFVAFFIVRLTSCLGATYAESYGDAALFIQTTALLSDRRAVQDPGSGAPPPAVAHELLPGATMPRAALPPEEILPALQEEPPTPVSDAAQLPLVAPELPSGATEPRVMPRREMILPALQETPPFPVSDAAQLPLVAPELPSGADLPMALSPEVNLPAVHEKTPCVGGGEVSPMEIQQLADFTQAVIKENRELREQNRKWTEYSAKLKEPDSAMQIAHGGHPEIASIARRLNQSNEELREQNANLQTKVQELTQQLASLRGQSDNTNAEWQKQLQIAYRDMQLQNSYKVLRDENEKYANENSELHEKYEKISAQALKLQSTFRSMEKENRDLKFATKNCHTDTKALSLEKIQLQADVQQSMKLEGDMANEIVGLKKDKEELKTMNAECRRALAMKS